MYKILTKGQQEVIKAYIRAHYDQWCDDEWGFSADRCAEDIIKHFEIKSFDAECECQGLAEEILDEKYREMSHYWAVQFGILSE